jgi:tetratricopeptide (TPR) repeat protein
MDTEASKKIEAALLALLESVDPTGFMAGTLRAIKTTNEGNQQVVETIEALEKARAGIKSGETVLPRGSSDVFAILPGKSGRRHKGEVLLAELAILTEVVKKCTRENDWNEAAQKGTLLLNTLHAIKTTPVDELSPYGAIADLVRCKEFGSAYREIGISFLNTGNFTQAEKILLMAIECDPQNAGFYVDLSKARSHGKIRDLEGAYKAAQKAIELSGDSASTDCYGQMQYVCIFKLNSREAESPDRFKKMVDEAKHWGNLALKKSPDTLEIINNMGLIAEIEGNQEEALKWYARANEVAPTNPVAMANMERVQQRLGGEEA